MNKTTTSALTVAPLIAGGLVFMASTGSGDHSSDGEYVLTSEAIDVIPVDNELYNNAAIDLYLKPLGFDGTMSTLPAPINSNVGQSVELYVHALVQEVEARFHDGDFSASDPLYIFGYSQGAVVASLAEEQLEAAGIPTGEDSPLHFVMVGDTASAHGGWLNSFVDSLPESWRQFATVILDLFGLHDVLGTTTPDDLYPTDVYTLTGDGWANWTNGDNALGMFVDHLEYLGLTPDEVDSATLSFSDDLTNYYTIDSADVDGLSALLNTFMVALGIGV